MGQEVAERAALPLRRCTACRSACRGGWGAGGARTSSAPPAAAWPWCPVAPSGLRSSPRSRPSRMGSEGVLKGSEMRPAQLAPQPHFQAGV